MSLRWELYVRPTRSNICTSYELNILLKKDLRISPACNLSMQSHIMVIFCTNRCHKFEVGKLRTKCVCHNPVTMIGKQHVHIAWTITLYSLQGLTVYSLNIINFNIIIRPTFYLTQLGCNLQTVIMYANYMATVDLRCSMRRCCWLIDGSEVYSKSRSAGTEITFRFPIGYCAKTIDYHLSKGW
jgi:hypothetical protein